MSWMASVLRVPVVARLVWVAFSDKLLISMINIRHIITLSV
jgi:hypothetical protein